MKYKRVWLSLGLATALSACSTTVGRDFDTDNVSQMQVGQTTTEQTITALGDPFSRNIAPDGSEKWQYHLTKASGRLTGKHFIPFVGPFLKGANKGKMESRILDLGFQSNVLSSCKLVLRNSSGSGGGLTGGGTAAEMIAGGTTREIACGNGQPVDGATKQ